MKALVINASPKMDAGNTAVVLNPFLEGLRESGAEVELLYTAKLDIKPCCGELACWHNTPGVCVHHDDMEQVLPKLSAAEIWVFATPVYVDGMAGPLKNLFDRIVPTAQPLFEMRDGHCRHPFRGTESFGKMVLVSNCGFWEMDNFDPLLAHMRAIAKNAGRRFAGALLRPHGPALKPMLAAGAPVGDVLDAAREAGRQLARRGEMTEEVLARVSRPLLPLEKYFKAANQNS
jgi:multimeric flavodoxin WrbA